MPINNEAKSVVIIGAGPAGLTAAWCLAKLGYSITVVESGSEVGGLSKSFDLWGHTVDYGPHRFFCSDVRVNELWLDAVDGQYHMVPRLTRIYYQGKYYNYPLDIDNVLSNLGIFRSAKVLVSYLLRGFSTVDVDNFENWTISRFGRELYEMFFKTYSERLWGMPCTDLDADFARQRIRKLSLFEVVKAALFGNNRKHKTLADVFAYPDNGSGDVYSRMAQKLEQVGVKVLCNESVINVEQVDYQVVAVQTLNERYACDYLISTMPITTLVRSLGPTVDVEQSLSHLKFRNTILVYVHVNRERVNEDQWIYIHDSSVQSGRITNFSNWGINGGLKTTVLCLEYWCNETDSFWSLTSADLQIIAAEDLLVALDVKDSDILDFHVEKINKSYPIYRCGYTEHIEKIQKYVDLYQNVLAIGRYGSFKYNNQDHSILMGILAAEKITTDPTINLWSVNSDTEYQEASRITADGLVVDAK